MAPPERDRHGRSHRNQQERVLGRLFSWGETVKLKTAGFFRELPHGAVDGPSIREGVASSPQQDEGRIIEYLKNGSLFVASTGIAKDVLDQSAIVGSPHVLTDGVWAWPADLAYYVEKYHVRLPAEFAKHMALNSWAVPLEDAIEFDAIEL